MTIQPSLVCVFVHNLSPLFQMLTFLLRHQHRMRRQRPIHSTATPPSHFPLVLLRPRNHNHKSKMRSHRTQPSNSVSPNNHPSHRCSRNRTRPAPLLLSRHNLAVRKDKGSVVILSILLLHRLRRSSAPSVICVSRMALMALDRVMALDMVGVANMDHTDML